MLARIVVGGVRGLFALLDHDNLDVRSFFLRLRKARERRFA